VKLFKATVKNCDEVCVKFNCFVLIAIVTLLVSTPAPVQQKFVPEVVVK
jgi:hypothetical protein